MNELLRKLHEMHINASYDGNNIPEAEALDKAIQCVRTLKRIKDALDDEDISDGAVCDIAYNAIKEIEE